VRFYWLRLTRSSGSIRSATIARTIPSPNGYTSVPSNGSFLRIGDGSKNGWIGGVMGAAVVHVDGCAPLGGCPGVVDFDAGGACDDMANNPIRSSGPLLRIA
jgi:hypothetical protein